jgi:SnoaL-like domain
MGTPDQTRWRLPGWAHHSGALAMGGPLAGADPDAARLVVERVARYCWAYDERRADLLADCFTVDGVWEGNVVAKVPVGPFAGRASIIKWLTEFWPHQHDQRRHMLLNNLVESLSEGSAVTLSYLLLMSSDGQAPKVECTGFYRCELSREGETWRIARMSACFDAPFWPGQLETMSERGKHRHGVLGDRPDG